MALRSAKSLRVTMESSGALFKEMQEALNKSAIFAVNYKIWEH